MRVLITGGAGSLGRVMVRHLQAGGHAVEVVDDGSTGDLEAAGDDIGRIVHPIDVADEAALDGVFGSFGPSHVIHAAASYADPDDWLRDTTTNVAGSINVARCAERYGVERVVNLQTALCYGRPDAVPIQVTHPLRPFTSYGISKTAGESYLLASEAPVVSLRVANVCSPGLAIGPIPAFYSRLRAGSPVFCTEAVRDYLDYRDYLALLDRVLDPTGPVGVFNASTGIGYSVAEVLAAVAEHLGVGLDDSVRVEPVGADDVKEVVLDPAETLAAFGWAASLDFQTMIAELLDWYDEHGVGELRSHLRWRQ